MSRGLLPVPRLHKQTCLCAAEFHTAGSRLPASGLENKTLQSAVEIVFEKNTEKIKFLKKKLFVIFLLWQLKILAPNRRRLIVSHYTSAHESRRPPDLALNKLAAADISQNIQKQTYFKLKEHSSRNFFCSVFSQKNFDQS